MLTFNIPGMPRPVITHDKPRTFELYDKEVYDEDEVYIQLPGTLPDTIFTGPVDDDYYAWVDRYINENNDILPGDIIQLIDDPERIRNYESCIVFLNKNGIKDYLNLNTSFTNKFSDPVVYYFFKQLLEVDPTFFDGVSYMNDERNDGKSMTTQIIEMVLDDIDKKKVKLNNYLNISLNGKHNMNINNGMNLNNGMNYNMNNGIQTKKRGRNENSNNNSNNKNINKVKMPALKRGRFLGGTRKRKTLSRHNKKKTRRSKK
jgi:hypothetical protein